MLGIRRALRNDAHLTGHHSADRCFAPLDARPSLFPHFACREILGLRRTLRDRAAETPTKQRRAPNLRRTYSGAMFDIRLALHINARKKKGAVAKRRRFLHTTGRCVAPIGARPLLGPIFLVRRFAAPAAPSAIQPTGIPT